MMIPRRRGLSGVAAAGLRVFDTMSSKDGRMDSNISVISKICQVSYNFTSPRGCNVHAMTEQGWLVIIMKTSNVGQKSQLDFCQSMIKCATTTRDEWAISD